MSYRRQDFSSSPEVELDDEERTTLLPEKNHKKVAPTQ